MNLPRAGVPEARVTWVSWAETELFSAETGFPWAEGSGRSRVTPLPLPSTVAECGSTARSVHPEALLPIRTPEAVPDDWS